MTVLLSGMADEITKSMDRLADVPEGEVERVYTDYQNDAYKLCKEVTKHTQDLVLKSSSNPNEMVSTSRELTSTYSQLVDSARGALATIESTELASRLRKAVYDLGEASKSLIHSASSVQGNPGDKLSKKDLSNNARTVTEKV